MKLTILLKTVFLFVLIEIVENIGQLLLIQLL